MIGHSLEKKLEQAWPLGKWQDVRTVIAVSGGADSVALLRAVHAIAINRKLLTIAHFNHNLRGAESDRDQQFVVELGSQIGIVVETAKDATDAILGGASKIGIESSARNARYEFFKQVATRIGARYLLTAHTADDQAETVLHNICRGTGLAGVAGIPFARPINEAVTVIRPFLDVTRCEVIDYLDQLNQAHQSDESNAFDEFTRNRIRNHVLPQLEKEVNGSTRKHLCQLAQVAREAIGVLDEAVEALSGAILFRTANEVLIACDRLAGASRLLLVHFLKRLWAEQAWSVQEFDTDRWHRIVHVIKAADPMVGHLPGNVQFVRRESEIRFRIRQNDAQKI